MKSRGLQHEIHYKHTHDTDFESKSLPQKNTRAAHLSIRTRKPIVD